VPIFHQIEFIDKLDELESEKRRLNLTILCLIDMSNEHTLIDRLKKARPAVHNPIVED